jgi:hypothetical protein
MAVRQLAQTTRTWAGRSARTAVRGGTQRSLVLVFNGVLMAVLAACGGGNSNSSDPSISTAVDNTPAACTTAPAGFNAVWKDMNPTCTNCHATGQLAGGTNLVFAPSGTDMQNYNVLRDYAKTSSALLLSKPIGLPNHAGGKPYGDANSPQSQALANLIPQMVAQVCTVSNSGPTASTSLLQGVSMMSDATTLAKASVLFAARNPTASEAEAVRTGGEAALRQTIRSYMQGPAFESFMYEVGDTFFLTPGVVVRGNAGYNVNDWPLAGSILNANGVTQAPGAVINRFDMSARREPIELMRYIVRNDLPYTDMVSGNYTVVNGIMAEFLGAQVDGTFTNKDDDNEFRKATLPSARLGGMREHAGVLSTHPWLQRFPTTDTNRNRHRVSTLFKQFLATDVSALAARPLDDGAKFKVPTVENPACAACHDTMDPVAAGFQNWNENNRYLPNRTGAVDHALPNSYRSNNYPKDAANRPYYMAGDNWFRDGKAPGFGATPMPGGVTGNPAALQWLGQQVAADPRFALGAVHFWYQGVFGRAPLKAPYDQSSPQFAALQAAYQGQSAEFQAIAARFRTDRGHGAYNVRDLLVDLVMSPLFRAERTAPLTATRAAELMDIGSVNMLTPGQLNRKLMGVVGQTWNEFDNPYRGWALNYGDFDGNQRTTRAKSHTMMQGVSVARLAAVKSCSITKADFDKPSASRLLFPLVALTDTPASASGQAAILENIRFLHKALWKEDLPATDAEVQRTLKLFNEVWGDRLTAPARPVNCAYNAGNDAAYTGRAWAAVMAYMLGDPKFLYE